MDSNVFSWRTAAVLLLFSGVAHGEALFFDSAAIENTTQISASSIDLSKFIGSKNPPGNYYVTVKVNNRIVAKRNFDFIENKEGKLYPVLSVTQLHELGVYLTNNQIDADDNYQLPGELSGINISFDFRKQLLNINIPQAYLKVGPDADLSIAPSQWDEGISAFSLNYDLNGAQRKKEGESFKPDDSSLRLNSGINLGAWRLRSAGMLDKPADSTVSWNSEKTWLQRDIPALRSLVMLGDNGTDGNLFDSVDYRGVSLATDDAMFSDQVQGYAPTIRGIAKTSNARVEVSQNGNVIYQRYVPAGQFVINDLFPQSGGGELKVTITEADGSVHHFTQAWGVVPAMQREGHLRYSLDMGRTHGVDANNQQFSQFTFFYGLPAETTMFGGDLLSKYYHAFDLGYAVGLGDFGSTSVDITSMTTQGRETPRTHGQSYRIRYAKNFTESNTDMSVSWSFAPTDGYISFSDAIAPLDSDNKIPVSQKNRWQISVNQPVGDINTLVLSAWRADYWHQSTDKNLSLSDTLSLGDTSISLSWAWTQNEENNSEQQFAMNVQIPFSVFNKDIWASFSSNVQRPGAPSQSIGINGNAFADDALSWSVDASHGDSQSTSQDVHLDYKNSGGQYIANYSHATERQSLSYEVKGSFIASAYGFTAGQPFSTDNAVALVKAESASNLPVKNNIGVATDYRGYAIVPYLQPYRQNSVTLEQTAASKNSIELTSSSVSAIPTESAIVMAEFMPHIGAKILVTLHLPNGKPLPFGATATVDGLANEGIIDEKGQVYLSGAPLTGSITAQWESPTQECHAPYKINTASGKHLYELQLICQ
ncbi:fimbria/pilus outer membrane usher protein [Pseudescherichia sp.]|uniref:fimbria/pilus outer membrane usher protein n=1 Tax=Pseudescherichia sp. TaxID=2055881 RepID=UPI0028983FD2|nr:fimbria/pilus outer membrane usher protein [Pseudescherichia sp.]